MRNFEKLCGAGEFVLVFIPDDLLLAFYLRESATRLESPPQAIRSDTLWGRENPCSFIGWRSLESNSLATDIH